MFYLDGIDPKCRKGDYSDICKPACQLPECRLKPSKRFGALAAGVSFDESAAEELQPMHWQEYCFLRKLT